MSNDIINTLQPLFSLGKSLWSPLFIFGTILIKWSIVFNYCKGCNEHDFAPKVHRVKATGYHFESHIKKGKNKILKTIYFVDASLFNLLLVGAFTVHLSCLLDSICLQ